MTVRPRTHAVLMARPIPLVRRRSTLELVGRAALETAVLLALFIAIPALLYVLGS